MLELQTLCMTLSLIKVYPCMKFHYNSMSRTWVIVKKRRSETGKARQTGPMDRQTDEQTDRQTEGGEVIPKHRYL